LLKLELEGRNRVWVAIIRNAFAPLLKGKFDYVVGNPPWVNWENLPESYREASKSLWGHYGLTEVTGKVGLGKVKRDLAMLFLARCFDRYLAEGGVLGFLITLPCGLIPGLFRLFSLPYWQFLRRLRLSSQIPYILHLKAYCHASIPLP
jgi:hypothetical protein